MHGRGPGLVESEGSVGNKTTNFWAARYLKIYVPVPGCCAFSTFNLHEEFLLAFDISLELVFLVQCSFELLLLV